VPSGIVAFAKDWHEDPTSNHHVLRELARRRRVLWLNSVATRTPKLTSGRDLGKIRRKLGEFARGPINVENDLWVFTPLVLPLPHNPIARAINARILRATIRGLRWRLGMDDFQLWTFLPNVGDYVGTLGESMSVYYCVDEWSMFSYVDREHTAAAERALLAKVDCVFAINGALADAKRAVQPETHVSPHGVDHAAFARALDDTTPVPAALAGLPRPIIGFYGTLQDWVDYELVAAVARARPKWSFVLLGQQLVDLSLVRDLPNVHLPGRKPHEELPGYCKGFDVGWIPYRIDERMTFVNPIKLREYLSAGLPVVSTPVPEVERVARTLAGDVDATACAVAGDAAATIAAIERAVAADTPVRRRARSARMATETWSGRVDTASKIIDDIERRRRP
jgi:glycosyltransferase involved in cell wall biosynthesis